MGQEQSVESETREVTPEQFGNELAIRFAEKCYSQLELYCFKQVFRNLADREADVRFWSESSLCRFLELPDVLGAGPVVYQMVTFLGAFPFPSQAPCIVTKEALIKVITLMTERHERVLKRGRRDRLKLFYGSLAVFDRRASERLEAKPQPDKLDGTTEETKALEDTMKGVSDFAIDDPANDDDDEIQNDDDELALAALDALDDIQAISLSEKPNLQHSIIPTDNLLKLIELLLIIAPHIREDSLSTYCSSLSDKDWEDVRRTASNIITLFGSDNSPGVTFRQFRTIVPNALPYMFDGFSPVFERFLFQKDFDLSKRRPSISSPPQGPVRTPSNSSNLSRTPSASMNLGHSRSRNATISHAQPSAPPTQKPRHTRSASYSSSNFPAPPQRSMSVSSSGFEPFPEPIAEEPQPLTYQDLLPELTTDDSGILNPPLLSQISFFIPPMLLFGRLNPLYAGTTHGFSLNSFEKQVFSWNGPSLLLVRGTVMEPFSHMSSSTPMSPGGITSPVSPSLTNPSERQFHSHLPPQRHQPSVDIGKPVVYGAYMPQQLKATHKAPIRNTSSLLFQLSPTHDVFRASDISTNHITFCASSTDMIPGLAFGAALPTPNSGGAVLPLGAVSLFLDGALEYGVFTHSAGGGGSFYPSTSPSRDRYSGKGNWEDRFEIESIEVWGLGGEKEVRGQRRAMEFEEREAKIRREGRGSVSGSAGVEADRELLKMAGLIGRWDERGGSMG